MSTSPLGRSLGRSLDRSLPLESRDPGCTPRRRVRHDARDAVTVMVFSATASTAVALLLTLVVRMGG